LFKKHLQSRDALWSRIELEETKYHEFVEREKKVGSQIDSSKAKLRFLEGLDAAFEGYSHGVRSLLEKKLPGTRGIVADLISVRDPELIALVERALGSSIQTVVFTTDANLRAAVEYLTREKVGVARMISLEHLAVPQAIAALEDSIALRGSVVAKGENAKVADYFLNRLLVCDTVETALSLQPRLCSDDVVVSKDGTICYGSGVTVAGAKKTEQVGILQRKQEIEKLKIDLVSFQKEFDIVVHDKEICIIARDEAKRALIEIDEKLNAGRQIQHEQETNIRHYENEIENTGERLRILVPEMVKNRATCEELEGKIKEHGAAIEQIAHAREDLERQIERVKSLLTEMDAERKERAEHLKNIELATQGLANRIDQDKQSVIHLRKDLENIGSSRQKKIEDKNNAIAEIQRLQEKIIILQESLDRQTSHRVELAEVFEQVREEYSGIVNAIEEVRRTIKEVQNSLDEHSNRKHGLEVEQTRDEEKKRAIREKIYSGYEIDLESPPENTPILDSEDVDVLDNISTLKERIKRVGDVNMGAIHEYEQESAELKNMVVQRDDLQKAVDDLEDAIKRLNKEARVQFSATFGQVQRNFIDMFTTLFEGGEATLTLEEGVDPLDAAIIINVKPAGKKMRGVTLLSGGERALTAISLLFALYMVKPSAYCILDELDASLDDANVDRFIRILHKFSQTTQFIVITHNRYTMEAADVLYGVTQVEKGVSVIASVQLADFQEEAKAA
jgi:chromosome segregation protein